MFVATLVFLQTSCSNVYDEMQSCNDTSSSVEDKNLAVLFNSLDSLNACYPTSTTRGKFWGGAGTSIADNVGRALGGKIGGRVGGTIGSLTGNPMGTIGGYIIGAKFGPMLCSAIASGFANMWLSCSVPNSSTSSLVVKSDMAFKSILDEKDAVLGRDHNIVMGKILTNPNRYGYGIKIDESKLYDDIVENCKKLGYSDSTYSSPEQKEKIIKAVRVIYEPLLKFEKQEIDEREFIEKYVEILTLRYRMDERAVNVFRNFTCKIAFKCAQLNEEQIHSYSEDLCKTIKESSIQEVNKIMIANSAQLVINSTLCWQQ